MRVPYLDLRSQYEALKPEIDGAIRAVIEDSAFIRGNFVADFELKFAAMHGFKEFVGTGNGTDALFVALKALGAGPGDEVITAANSWIASSECITLTGATPVFADIDPDTYTIDPTSVADRITSRTRALIPVHLYGQAADMEAINQLAAQRDLRVIEDCAQAHLAKFAGRLVGTWGDAGAFSFYPGKNLGAYGDAGGIGTNNAELATKIRVFADHGSDPGCKHRHLTEGINSRLDGIQAAVLSVKLKQLQKWTEGRVERACWYDELLQGVGDIVIPRVRPGSTHVYHIYCIRTRFRGRLIEDLRTKGIGTAVHYPTALPFLDAYSRFAYRPGDYPVSHRYQSEILSLPIYPEMSEGDVGYVASAIREFF